MREQALKLAWRNAEKVDKLAKERGSQNEREREGGRKGEHSSMSVTILMLH